MRLRYSFAPCRSGGVSADYVVRELHPAGGTAQITCYCWGEATARMIAEALNVRDAIHNSLMESKS